MLQKLILFTLPIRIFNYRPNNAACFLSAPLASDNTIALKKKKTKKNRVMCSSPYLNFEIGCQKNPAQCAHARAPYALLWRKKSFFIHQTPR